MMKTKKSKMLQAIYMISASLILLWMVLLTAFSIWAWNQHIWQTRVDNESIYKLMVDNAEQQVKIDELSK